MNQLLCWMTIGTLSYWLPHIFIQNNLMLDPLFFLLNIAFLFAMVFTIWLVPDELFLERLEVWFMCPVPAIQDSSLVLLAARDLWLVTRAAHHLSKACPLRATRHLRLSFLGKWLVLKLLS